MIAHPLAAEMGSFWLALSSVMTVILMNPTGVRVIARSLGVVMGVFKPAKLATMAIVTKQIHA